MKIIAHRGASHYAPENTLAAFKKALEQDVDGIELDVRLTKDAIPVISHDATVNRLSNSKGFIHDYKLKQLKKMDFGKSFSRQFKHEPIATLEEVLDLYQDTQHTLHIEIKNGPEMPEDIEEKILKLVEQYAMADRVIYSSFDHQCLERLWQLNNSVATKFALLFHINLIEPFKYIDRLKMPIHALHPNHFYVDKKYIRMAHKRNFDVNVYTVNQKKLAKQYQKMGVDGLITNDPMIMK